MPDTLFDIADTTGGAAWSPPPAIAQRPHELIRASAGSGKTYALSNRYLALLSGGALPATILATTFTRKAAGEILERVLRRLAQAVLDNDKRNELAKGLQLKALSRDAAAAMLQSLRDHLHRVAISTIDSFFHRMASVFRFELNLPPGAAIVDDGDPQLMQLRRRAIEAMLGEQELDVLVELLRRLHHDDTKRSVTAAIDEIVASMYETFRRTNAAAWRTLAPPPAPAKKDIDDALAQLARLAANNDYKTFAKAITGHLTAFDAKDWKEFLGKGVIPKIATEETPTFSRKPIPDEIIGPCNVLIAAANAQMLADLAAATVATHELLEQFDAHYTPLRHRHRILLFADMPHKLAHELPGFDEALRDELYYRLDATVRHLLLDEFQDTNDDQWSILRPFAQEITATADGSRTFFCVGDVKQAIYGWRGARAEIFDRMEGELPLGDEAVQTLATSWRSSQIVLDVVNQVFGGIADNPILHDDEYLGPFAAKWRTRFEDHSAQRELPGYVELCASPAPPPDAAQDAEARGRDDDDDDDDGFTGDDTHERFIAARVRALLAAGPGFNIGILAPRNMDVHRLLHALRREGVEASGEGRAAIVGDPAVDAILAAIRMADHPGHTVAAYHVVNSPLGKIIGLRSASPEPRRNAAARIRGAVFTRGLAPVIADWARKLAPACDETNARRLVQLIELAERYDPTLTLRIRDFIDYIEASQLEEPAPAPVRVMTIHKAKGLEFDIVFVSGLERRLGQVSRRDLMELRDDATGDTLAVHRYANSTTRALCPPLEEAYRYEQARRFQDDVNGLYVAMTRPRHALHMIVRPLRPKKGGTPRTEGWSDQSFAALLRKELSTLDEHDPFEGDCLLYEHGDAAWYGRIGRTTAPITSPSSAAGLPLRVALKKSDAQSTRSHRRRSPSGIRPSRTAADLIQLEPSQGQRIGTLIHHWFSLIEWLDDSHAGPDDQTLRAEAAKALHPPPDAAWVDEQLARFRDVLARPAVAAALTRPAGDHTIEVWREKPFAVAAAGGLVQGVFDRVHLFRDPADTARIARAEIIDFKTDEPTPQRTIASIVEEYTPQLQAYCEALMRMLGLKPDQIEASLLLLAPGQRRVIPWPAV